MTGLERFNLMKEEEAREKLAMTCGSSRWISLMLARRPFTTRVDLFIAAESIWEDECNEEDWLEAFSHHPRIGDIDSLEEKYANTFDMAMEEQAAVSSAPKEIIQALANANRLYEEKFGYIFIVKAAGKSAEEMLSLIQIRLKNEPRNEIGNAALEQYKITALRLEKMLEDLP